MTNTFTLVQSYGKRHSVCVWWHISRPMALTKAPSPILDICISSSKAPSIVKFLHWRVFHSTYQIRTSAIKGHDILYYFKRHIGERNLFASFMNFRLKPAEFSNNASYFSIRHDYIAVVLIFTVWAVCVCVWSSAVCTTKSKIENIPFCASKIQRSFPSVELAYTPPFSAGFLNVR